RARPVGIARHLPCRSAKREWHTPQWEFSSDRYGHAARGLSACAPKLEMRDLSRHVGFVPKPKSPLHQFGGDLLRPISGGGSPKPGLMAGPSRCTRFSKKERPWLVESLLLLQPLPLAFHALLPMP